jgi:hypothetical protein
VGGKSGTTLPDSVLSIGRCNDSDLGACGGKGDNFVLESVREAFVHGGATREDNVLTKILSDVDVGGRDGSPGKSLD